MKQGPVTSDPRQTFRISALEGRGLIEAIPRACHFRAPRGAASLKRLGAVTCSPSFPRSGRGLIEALQRSAVFPRSEGRGLIEAGLDPKDLFISRSEGRGLPEASVLFPRSEGRGLIEASEARPTTSSCFIFRAPRGAASLKQPDCTHRMGHLEDFRAPRGAASLKHVGRFAVYFVNLLFPRSEGRGLIEAMES